jgi:NADPH-dependent 2,4-dienoyl-CoA reductase/sulfur reductase-like enzyme/nitrite reductase/ring-hydroxylating ferredoxin subunit
MAGAPEPMSSMDAGMVEATVANVDDLKDGQMKEVAVGDAQVLLVREKGNYFALAAKCSHQAAPLKNSALCNGRIRCPLHGACFNVATGDIEDYPCVDALQTYKVQVKNGKVMVKAHPDTLKLHKRTPMLSKKMAGDDTVVAIIGGGPAAMVGAESLRASGYGGRVVLISKENYLPYDRTKLSKAMSSKASQILLRPPEFFKQYDIETMLGTEVKELDPTTKTITFTDGNTLTYNHVIVASGGDPRTLPVPGMNLANIYQVRVPDEANAIISSVDGKKVVIVGTSFIGMEAASCIAKKVKSCIAIGMEKVPFERVLGTKIGAALQKLHESNGVQFRLERVVKEFKGMDGKVSSVVLDNGEELEADVCIIGAGIVPATRYVKAGSLNMGRDGSIITDKYLKAADGVYAVGDLARYPYWITGELVRVEHYGMAQCQARVAAHNIVGKNEELRNVPFFWTTMYGKSIRYAGHALSYDDLVIDGDVDALSFVGYYVKGDMVVAVVAVNKDPAASAAAELYNANKMPTATQVKAGGIDLVAMANALSKAM